MFDSTNPLLFAVPICSEIDGQYVVIRMKERYGTGKYFATKTTQNHHKQCAPKPSSHEAEALFLILRIYVPVRVASPASKLSTKTSGHEPNDLPKVIRTQLLIPSIPM